MNLKFEIIDYSPQKWREIFNAAEERTIFQSPAWHSFLQKTQEGIPIIAALRHGTETLGYFSGMIIKRFGFKILGSPFPGWMTDYMGFNLQKGVSRRSAIRALSDMAFNRLKCIHFEVMDRFVRFEDLTDLGFQIRTYSTFEIDLKKTEERLFGDMTSACRRCIRKAGREGVTIEEAQDIEFAEDFYSQLEEVFGKRSLSPTYDLVRVRELIKNLLPTGQLLLLRARGPGGNCIATGIYPALNKTMHFWGGASWQKTQIFRPNEMLHWYAMRFWKKRGIETYDMGGGGAYKKKYGGAPIEVPWFGLSKYPWILAFRNFAKRAVRIRQIGAGALRK